MAASEDSPATPGILRKHNHTGSSAPSNRRLQFWDKDVHRSPKANQQRPPPRASASQRLEMIASQMQQRHQQMYEQQKQQEAEAAAAGGGGIGPARGSYWPPSRRREEATALRNLKRALANRVLRTGDEADAEEQQAEERDKHDDDDPLADELANLALDNRKQLIEKFLCNRPVALVSEGHEADTDWHDSEFISECLCWHNVYRQRHGVRNLVMSADLCDMAQSWANHLAHSNAFMYKPGETQVGQNLYCRLPNTVQAEVTGQEVAAYWYSAFKQYNYSKEPDVLHANVNAGHFTQLVWAGSRELGLGKARSRQGKTVVVAMYRPPGNVSGLFQQNVLMPAGPMTLLAGDLELAASGSDSSSSLST